MTEARIIAQSSTYDGALDLISQIESRYRDVYSTLPVKAADGSYLVSIHYNNKKPEVQLVDCLPARIF